MKENSEFSLEISLINIFSRLKKRWVMIVSITLVSTLVALGLVNFVVKPVYEAKIGIIAEIDRQDENSRVSDLSLYTNLMATYVAIANTSSIAKSTADEMKTVTAQELLQNITVTNEETAMVMYIGIKNTDPDLAYRSVRIYGEKFIEKAEKLMPEGRLTVLDEPVRPVVPVSPNKIVETAKGFFIGLIASSALAYLLERKKEKKQI